MSRPRPYRALRHRDYRRLWVSQLLSLTGSQMQTVAIDWHVYLLTRSPLALGLVGLTRFLPLVAFSLFGGIVADRRDRRVVVFAAQSVMSLVAATLAVLTFTGHDSIGWIYGLSAVLGATTAFDNPARNALIPRLVPPADLPGALSLNNTMFHTALIVGPALAGVIIAGSGAGFLHPIPSAAVPSQTSALALIYAFNAVSFVTMFATLVFMKTSGRIEAGGPPEPPLRALRAGLRFVFTTPIMIWTAALDFFATFFAGSMSLLPIFADQVLKVGPVGYGWLVAAPALGAVLGSLYTAIVPLPRRQGPVLLLAVGCYGLATVAYGLSRSFWLTLAALAATGLADVISTVIRQTLRQVITPDALRGRMMSVNMIFFMGGPQLGELEAGVLASFFASAAVGVTVSVVSGGIATILVAALAAGLTPVVRGYKYPPPAA